MSNYQTARYSELAAMEMAWWQSLGFKLFSSGLVVGALVTAIVWYCGGV